MISLINQFTQGKYYLVGGCVRDAILYGTFSTPNIKDFDVEVHDISIEEFESQLVGMNLDVDYVGKSFGVYKIHYKNHTFDFSFPRIETKNGNGYRGFDIQVSDNLSLFEATSRRDLTINAIMYDPIEGKYIDLHGGIEDIKNKIIRHVSDAFSEDPLRVLRVFQFTSRFGFTVHHTTIKLCKSLLKEQDSLTKERVWIEFEKWCNSKYSSIGLKFLKECGWAKKYGLDEISDEQYSIIDKCDNNVLKKLCVLCSLDYNLYATSVLLENIGCPVSLKKVIEKVCIFIDEKILIFSLSYLRFFFNAIVKCGIDFVDYIDIVKCFDEEYASVLEEYFYMLNSPSNTPIKPIINGDYIKEKYGLPEGKELGNMLKIFYDLQLNGRFDSVESFEKYIKTT